MSPRSHTHTRSSHGITLRRKHDHLLETLHATRQHFPLLLRLLWASRVYAAAHKQGALLSRTHVAIKTSSSRHQEGKKKVNSGNKYGKKTTAFCFELNACRFSLRKRATYICPSHPPITSSPPHPHPHPTPTPSPSTVWRVLRFRQSNRLKE